MKHTYSAGGVILDKQGRILLINEGGNFWGLPKGHQEDGETLAETARREIREEAGIDEVALLGELGHYERHPYDSGREDKTELKHITLFLFTTTSSPVTAANAEHNELRWAKPGEAVRLLTQPQDKEFLAAKLADMQMLIREHHVRVAP